MFAIELNECGTLHNNADENWSNVLHKHRRHTRVLIELNWIDCERWQWQSNISVFHSECPANQMRFVLGPRGVDMLLLLLLLFLRTWRVACEICQSHSIPWHTNKRWTSDGTGDQNGEGNENGSNIHTYFNISRIQMCSPLFFWSTPLCV